MKTVKVTIETELTPQQLLTILSQGGGVGFDLGALPKGPAKEFVGKLNEAGKAVAAGGVRKGTTKIYHPGPAPGCGRPAPVDNPGQYLSRNSTPTGRVGRPSKLTFEGMKKVWELHKLGYSNVEIAKGFNQVISADYVRRLLTQIKES